MDLTALAIKNNRITIIVLLSIFLAGILTYGTISRSEDPGFIIRTATVVTAFPGASPERVEMLVTDPIEKVVQEIPELDFVTSESKTGISVVYVNIKESEKVMRPIWDNLRRKVDKIRSDLPDGIIGPTVNDEFGDVFGVIVGLTGEGYSYAELKAVAEEVRDELLRIEDVAKVDISGAQEERIFIEYDDARLAELGITTFQLKNTLDQRNIIIPGGNILMDEERIVLEPSGNFESVEELGRTLVDLPGSDDVIYLEDVAEVKRGYIDPVNSKMNVNGVTGLALAVSIRKGGNITEMGAKVETRIRELRQLYPIGIQLALVSDQHRVVDDKVSDFAGNLLQSVGVVLLVMLLFLGLRTGMIVASLIPMVMVMSIFLMGLFDIGLDQVSLASLIIALGMLVDNAIVMSESIMVKMQDGESAFDAAVHSSKELRVPLLISSLTTSAAFLPIFMAKSSVGEYTAPLFKVVTIALLSSWVVALTMVPLLCVAFLKIRQKKKEGPVVPNLFQRYYRGALLFFLKRPLIMILLIVGLFFLSLNLFRYVPLLFFPEQDRNLITATLELPIGTAIERTEEVVGRLEDYMRNSLLVTEERREGIINWGTWIGQGAPKYNLGYNPQPSSPELGVMLINTSDYTLNWSLCRKIEAFCRTHFPDLQAVVKPLSNGPPVKYPIEIRISGKKTDRLFEIVGQVKSKLEETAGARNISDDWGHRTKKLFVRVNQTNARLAGITSQDIAVSLQTLLSGFQTGEYREGDKVIPITMRTVAEDRQDQNKLESINVYSQHTGQSVPLSQVANIELDWQPALIKRRNRYRTVAVTSELQDGFSAINITNSLLPWLEAQASSWPVGYTFEIGGENESSAEANQSIVEQLPIAGFIILILLVGQFNSLRKTFIVLTTIPLGLIGVIFGLVLFQSYFGFMTLLGLISLAGIVINNAIVLIDRIQIEQEKLGRPPQEAIIHAAQHRFRPILLTTATTILGLIPLYLGGGLMWEPMAIAIMIGLLFATVITLLFVPVMYRLLFGVSYQ